MLLSEKKCIFLPKIILNKCQLQKIFQYFGKILRSSLENVQKKIALKFQVNQLKSLKVILHAVLKKCISRKTFKVFFIDFFIIKSKFLKFTFNLRYLPPY